MLLKFFIEEIEFLGTKFIDVKDFAELLIRFAFNLLVSVIIIRYLYYPVKKRKDYFFTYILIGTVVFFLCYLLESVKLQIGFALGLFAIFGIIRYRTNAIPIKEMTYLFMVIGIAVMNALTDKKASYAELLFTNIAIVVITYVLEKVVLLKHESRKVIIYEKLELLKPENRKLLIADIEERTGLSITKVEVGRINYISKTARVRIYFENDFLEERELDADID